MGDSILHDGAPGDDVQVREVGVDAVGDVARLAQIEEDALDAVLQLEALAKRGDQFVRWDLDGVRVRVRGEGEGVGVGEGEGEGEG